jgi:hypothetical protein
MRSLLLPLFIVFATLGAGCSTTQEVVLIKASGAKNITTAVRMPEEGNSPQMTAHLEGALGQEGVSVKGQVPAGVQKAKDVDAVVSYVDVWRWDLVMYLQKLSVRIYDAESGDLLVTGNWSDSPLHGFRDAKLVVEGVVKEMLTKLRTAAQK